jgi:NADH dehydrogenase FAD-containing subunit
VFSRLKPRNKQAIEEMIAANKLKVFLNSNITSIEEKFVNIQLEGNNETFQVLNDLVYIFAGGELPVQFLKNVGIEITTKFGEAILKHEKR